MSKKIIIAGGGTGGHIFPAVAIANAIRKKEPGTEILFIGAKGKMEMEKVPQAGYNIKGIDIAGYNRSSLIRNIGLPFKVLKSFAEVAGIVRGFRPDAVIGVGGYSSFPVLRYAQFRGIRTFIHESNSFAGRSNILLGKKAARVFVAGYGMEKFFPREKIIMTGNPVRASIAESEISRAEGIGFFGLDADKTTILSTGGSLGARVINESIDRSIDEFASHDLQLIWQTGKLYTARAKEITEGRENIWTSDFITNMEYAFAAADIVISRAGAMAIAELCVVKKPVVFVPLSTAAEDHQTANAKSLVDKQAGLMVSDANAKDQLIETVIRLTKDLDHQQKLKNNIGLLAVTRADELIASEILKEINDRP